MRFFKKNCFIIFAICVVMPLTQAKSPKFSEAKIDYIKKKYEHTICKKKCLFYPAKNPKRLLISFCGAVPGIYSKFSWFWRNDENWQDTAYLFLRDDQLTWYLGNNKQDFMQDFTKLIRYFVNRCKLKPENVFVVGGSMGGYGALLYATLLGLKGVLLLNPQVNRASNYANRFAITRAEKRWKDLDAVVAAAPKAPQVSLIYGHFPQDQAAGEALVRVLKTKSSLTIIRRHPSLYHGVETVFSKEFIEREIAYMEQQDACLHEIDAVSGIGQSILPTPMVLSGGVNCLFYPAYPCANRLFVFLGKASAVAAHFPWIGKQENAISDTAYVVIDAAEHKCDNISAYVDFIAQIMLTNGVLADNVCVVGVDEWGGTAFLTAVALKAKKMVLCDTMNSSISAEWSQQVIQQISPQTGYTPETLLLSEGNLYSNFGLNLIDVLRHKPSLTILRHCDGIYGLGKQFFENEYAYMSQQIPFARNVDSSDYEELFDEDGERFKQGRNTLD